MFSRQLVSPVYIGLGLLGIFTSGPIFVPMAFLASLIALFSGQIIWGVPLSFGSLGGSNVIPAISCRPHWKRLMHL